ncbi:MAG: DUF2634 domain-containing protein [Porcipelethomonas sp.]
MASFIEIPIDEIGDMQESPSKTYCLDPDSGRISGYIDGIEAVRQAIRKALATARFNSLIYDDQYGSDLKALVSDGEASRELIEESIPGIVKDALLPDTRITDVYDFDISFDNDGIYISFTAETIFGTTEITEVSM